MDRYTLRLRLLKLGKRNIDVINELDRRGIATCEQAFSRSFSDAKHKEPKQVMIREETEKILAEWEAAAGA